MNLRERRLLGKREDARRAGEAPRRSALAVKLPTALLDDLVEVSISVYSVAHITYVHYA